MAFKVLFIGYGNSCRSQMAAAFARKAGLRAESAGIQPDHEVSANTIFVMEEKGVDVASARPRRLDRRLIPDYDRVVIMGPGVQENSAGLVAHEDWEIHPVLGQGIDGYRRVRDEIHEKVKALADELQEWHRA